MDPHPPIRKLRLSSSKNPIPDREVAAIGVKLHHCASGTGLGREVGEVLEVDALWGLIGDFILYCGKFSLEMYFGRL